MTALVSYFCSLCGKLSLKMSLFIICKIFRLFVLTHWLQMTSTFSVIVRICRNQFKCNCLKKKKSILDFLLHFSNLHKMLNNLKNWRPAEGIYFRNYRIPKTWLDQFLKSPVTKNSSTLIILKISTHLRSLHDSTFIKFFITLGEIEFENVSVRNM